ncbi:hypothetical protein CDCA_CDCA18G4492 [Cyanidium caldarium]|uniref:Mitochondrial inner membrane protease ATP23 n=1 Tax=Cyanidium caldarium TaxID=2771 RepID=A0AAV9J1I6_CYACA|nr:hypothetical protein CDCA_CDCA18G4492 [Cyanidium caldarium]
MVVDVPVREATAGAELAQQRRCEAHLRQAVRTNRYVQQLLQALSSAGCAMDVSRWQTEVDAGGDSAVACRHCDADVGGGYQEDGRVVICANHMQSAAHVAVTLAHELIHAYDHCRIDLQWDNCLHHACSEIRAAALSGDCDWIREVARSNFRIGGQFQRCVKRRAEISVRKNRNCTPLQAREAVEQAFEACYRDTAPFDAIP